MEKKVAGRQSAERLIWTEEEKEHFKIIKIIHTYSDFSQSSHSIGGRMEVVRKSQDGKEKRLPAGHFSVMLDKHKSNWLACEGEALGCKLVLEHFSPWLRETKSTCIHHTDNMPCVQAWKRSLKGAYSKLSRISSFLSGLSALDVKLEYTPGKDMHNSDHASRNPIQCTNKDRCQICKFAFEQEEIGDEAKKIRTISIEEILSGRSTMPFIQLKTWKSIQENDGVHV